jgi:CubicO group peptidase (beta-lactamase class C family)
MCGAVADRAEPKARAEGTLQLMFSGSKGLVAVWLLMLIDRGQLDLDAPVRRYLPEFSAAGKGRLTVRDIVTHTARLPGLTDAVMIVDLSEDLGDGVAAFCPSAARGPRGNADLPRPDVRRLCGELIRRVDGRSVGRFFADEVAGPLDLELFIGLPEALEARVSRLELARPGGRRRSSIHESQNTTTSCAQYRPTRSCGHRTPSRGMTARFNQRRSQPVPAIGTARAIASLYGNLERLIAPKNLPLGCTELERRHEPILDGPQSFGVGFQLQTQLQPSVNRPMHVVTREPAAQPTANAPATHRVLLSYSMNLMRDNEADVNSRARALLDPLYCCPGE